MVLVQFTYWRDFWTHKLVPGHSDTYAVSLSIPNDEGKLPSLVMLDDLVYEHTIPVLPPWLGIPRD